MANPVTNFNSVKTLIAFAERAEKHGLAISEDLQKFIDEPEKMARLVNYAKAGAPVFQVAVSDINWPETYRKLGMKAEYAEAVKKLAFPPENPVLWVVPMIQGITCNNVVAAFRNDGIEVHTAYANDDLDAGMKHHDRDSKDGHYIIGFRRAIEADEENKDKSADMLAKENHKGITLPERLVLGYGYFITTGQHLDEAKITLCAGSRDSDGNVPRAGWYSGEFKVCWHNSGYRNDFLRSRSAVSLAA